MDAGMVLVLLHRAGHCPEIVGVRYYIAYNILGLSVSIPFELRHTAEFVHGHTSLIDLAFHKTD